MPAYVKPPDTLMLCLPPRGIYLGASKRTTRIGRPRGGPGSPKIGERRQNGLLGPLNATRRDLYLETGHRACEGLPGSALSIRPSELSAPNRCGSI
jgi:hypothetical protein